jgi:WD40 repeat protein/serine/threonine protein kinase
MAAPSTQTGALDDAVLDVFLDYLLAEDAGQAPDAAKLLADHADLADQLREVLDDREVVARQARPLRDVLRDVPDERPTDRPPDLAGYEPLRYLAEGGMGVVYVAWHTLAKRDEAIKVIRQEALAGPAERQRFLVEAQRAAGLEVHPNIIHVYYVGEVDGRPYFSMEYATGGNLAGRVQSLRGQWDEVATLLRTVARAVHFAHQGGVLHRDLKPANILLAADGTPRVADFGLAEPLRPDVAAKPTAPVAAVPPASETADYQPASGDVHSAPTVQDPPGSRQTSRRVIAGSPPYMAPEQARGDRKLTVATDVYGLGAVLYELLTGEPPFRGDSADQIRKQVLEQPPVPPRRRDRRVPRDLEAICLKCLEKDPARRYASAAALAEDLGRFLAGKPVEARRPGRPRRLLMWSRRQPLTAALVAVVALLLVALLAIAGRWMWRLIEEHEGDQQRLYDGNVGRAKQFIDAGQLDEARDALEGCPERLRGWDWHYLRRLCRQGLRLEGHEGAVQSVRYSPDGGRVVTGGQDGTARLWDAKTGELLRTFVGHHGRVTARFTAEGRLVVSAGEEKTVLVREADTGNEVLRLEGVGDLIACDRQGKHLAVFSAKEQKFRLYDLSQKRAVAERPYKAFVMAFDFSPDGSRLAVGGFESKIDLLSVPSLELVYQVSPPDRDTVWALAFSPDGNRLVASLRRPLVVDLTNNGKVLAVLPGTGMYHCHSLAFSPDGKGVVGAGNDGYVRVWDLERGVMVRGPAQQAHLVNDAVFSPDGTALAISRGKAVVVEPLAPRVVMNQPIASYPEAAEVEAVAFSHDGNKVASLVADKVLLHDLGGRELFRFDVPRGQPGRTKRCLRVEAGRVLVAAAEASDDRPRVVIRDAVTGDEVASTWVTHEVQSLAFDHQGRLHWGDSGGHVRRWDGVTGRAAETLEVNHGQAVTALACSQDGSLLATGGLDLTVQIWRGGKRLHVRRGHDSPPECLSFSHDGRRLVSGGSDGRMKVWDVESGVELFELSGHEGKVITALAFDRAGKQLVSCGHDGVVRLWDGTPE